MAVNNVSEMNDGIAQKYQGLVKQLDIIRKSPRELKSMQFFVPEAEDLNADTHGKTNEIFQKYENIVAMLQKVKIFIKDFEGEFFIDFEVDKENYTTAVIARDCGLNKDNKIYLWKSIYKYPDYIKYIFTPDGNCKIVKIISQQKPMGHKSFMLTALFRAVEEYNSSVIADKYEDGEQARQIIRRIIVELSENRKEDKQSLLNFFMKKGFEFTNEGIYKFV